MSCVAWLSGLQAAFTRLACPWGVCALHQPSLLIASVCAWTDAYQGVTKGRWALLELGMKRPDVIDSGVVAWNEERYGPDEGRVKMRISFKAQVCCSLCPQGLILLETCSGGASTWGPAMCSATHSSVCHSCDELAGPPAQALTPGSCCHAGCSQTRAFSPQLCSHCSHQPSAPASI